MLGNGGASAHSLTFTTSEVQNGAMGLSSGGLATGIPCSPDIIICSQTLTRPPIAPRIFFIFC